MECSMKYVLIAITFFAAWLCFGFIAYQLTAGAPDWLRGLVTIATLVPAQWVASKIGDKLFGT